MPLRRARGPRLDQRGRRRVARGLRRARRGRGRGGRARRRRRHASPASTPDCDARARTTAFDPATARARSRRRRRGARPTRSRWPTRTASRRTGSGRSAEQEQAVASTAGRRRVGAPDRRVHEGDLHRAERPQRLRARRRAWRVGELDAARARRARRGEGAARPASRSSCRRASTRSCSSRRPSAGCSTCSARRAFNGLAHAEGRGALGGPARRARSPRRRSTCPTRPRFAAHAAARVRRRGHAEGAAAADPGRRGPRGRARHAQRRARRRGARTGHALAPGGDPSGPHPTNLVLAGGGAADEARALRAGRARHLRDPALVRERRAPQGDADHRRSPATARS